MKRSPLWKGISCPPSKVTQGKGKVAEEVLPGEFIHSLQPSWFWCLSPVPQHCCLSQHSSLARQEVFTLPLSQCCPWRFPGPGLSLPHSCPLPRRYSKTCRAAGQASCRSSKPGPRLHLTCCVQANLSFFFHYPGMYCHLIFMYAILPDKYDLLPGNSSDVHSVPCSNYGSHSWHGGGRAAAARWYTCQTGRGTA